MRDEVSCGWDMLGIERVPSFLTLIGGIYLEVGYTVVVGQVFVTLWSRSMDSMTRRMILAWEIGDCCSYSDVEIIIALLNFHCRWAPFYQYCG